MRAAPLLLLAVLSTCACRPRDPVADARAAPGRPPNILLLTVDTLRADRLALYGYSRTTMPNVEAFARAGAVVFDQSVVPRGSTRPSYASMLTGLLPIHHGVRSNAIVLHEQLETLPERLTALGYHCAGFVSNFVLLGEQSGCWQGFAVYDDRLEDRETLRPNFERVADRTLQAILDWLATDPPEPYFLFVNFIDPHGPYNPPPQFRARFQSDQQRLLTAAQIPAYLAVAEQTDFFDYADRYDAEIAYVDDALGRLIATLRQRGEWDDALVLFTADHGESLGEHHVYFEHHWHVFEETVRVPLIVRLPGAGTRPARRVSALSSPLDLLPTILDHLHQPIPPDLDGRSLLPLLAGLPAGDRALFLEFPQAATSHKRHPDEFAIRTRSHKLRRLYDQDSGALILESVYDLQTDPLEQRPIPFRPDDALHGSLSAELERALAQARAYRLPFQLTEYEMPMAERADYLKQRRPEDGRIRRPLDADQIEKLRSLGYVP